MNIIYTVSQINKYIHGRFETDERLRSVAVSGELSNVKYHSSGHIYFTLKDSGSSIAAVMFSSARSSLTFRMTEGQKVTVYGSISVYERDGKYQLYASAVKLSGEGELYEKFEKLKNELQEMGMFDAIYKKRIPEYVQTLGVVTAPTGAAVRDIINVSRRRFPYIQIIVYPAKVQGEGAAESVAAGIRALDAYGVDCIIAGRGGGSIEDLWAFNEEVVARAIFDCNTPVISAVGHETDTTIADYVADMRAPTPSAGAELAVFDYDSFCSHCDEFSFRLGQIIKQKIKSERVILDREKARLMALSPSSKLREQKLRLSTMIDKLEYIINNKLDESKRTITDYDANLTGVFDSRLHNDKHRLELIITKLQGLSPLIKLSQGYAMAESKDGKTLNSIDKADVGDDIIVHVIDGAIEARVTGKEKVSRG